MTSECNSFQSTAAESKQKLNWVDHTIIWPVLLISSRYIRVDLYALIEAEGCMREPSLSWSDHIACNHQIRELCRECYPNKILQYGNCKTSTWTTWQKSLQTRHNQWIEKSKTFLARINETQWNSMKLNETEWNWMKLFNSWNFQLKRLLLQASLVITVNRLCFLGFIVVYWFYNETQCRLYQQIRCHIPMKHETLIKKPTDKNKKKIK